VKNLIKRAVQYAKANPEQTKALADKAMTTVKKFSGDQKKKSSNKNTIQK